MDLFTVGRRHDKTTWTLIFGADSEPAVHRAFYNANKFRKKHRTWAETVLCGINGHQWKKFNRKTGVEIDSSSSSSSSNSSSSSSTVASVTSSSSSTVASVTSSSSSSSGHSSSSSSSTESSSS